MKFKSEKEAKDYCIRVSSGYLSLDAMIKKIESYKDFMKISGSNEEKIYWQNEIKGLENWINSDTFKNGAYPRGIDELFLELIEWRASIYAFQHADTHSSPFTKYPFHSQWLMGGIYSVFSLIGKLVSKNRKDNSLRRLWNSVYQYIESSGLCGEGEIALIKDKMHNNKGYFTNLSSKALMFRNKAIAHNEAMPRVEWDAIDNDIQFLCRLWSLLTMWSSSGIFEPFRRSEIAFSGLDNVFTTNEISLLKKKRDEYLEMVNKWCVSSLINGEIVTDRKPFAKLIVSIKSISSPS